MLVTNFANRLAPRTIGMPNSGPIHPAVAFHINPTVDCLAERCAAHNFLTVPIYITNTVTMSIDFLRNM